MTRASSEEEIAAHIVAVFLGRRVSHGGGSMRRSVSTLSKQACRRLVTGLHHRLTRSMLTHVY